MEKNDALKISILLFFIVISALFLPKFSSADILTFGSNSVVRCPATDAICSCGDSGGGVYRCDNSDFNDTLESSVTIDTCSDGVYLAPFDGSALTDFYELVREITREDLNLTNEGGKNDPYVRAGDYITVTVSFLCAVDGDAYSILYKNSTSSSAADWQLLAYGTCYSDDYVNYLSQVVPINATFQLDDVVGNHTIRAMISYSTEHPEATCGQEFDDPDYSDTDDLVMEVVEKLDSEEPDISVITPSLGETIQQMPGMIVWINATITDQTGISFVNITVTTPNNSTVSLNFTNSSGLYSAMISNVTELGLYQINFFANDTIEQNVSGKGTYNHVNNYTSTHFYIRNDVYATIISPNFSQIYPYRNVLLDFILNNNTSPNNRAYYILNNVEVNLSGSKYFETANSTSYFMNNSQNNLSQSFVPTKNMTLAQVALLLKRAQSNESNSTLSLVLDQSGPFGQVLANAVFSGVENQSFVWKKISLNQTVSLSSGQKYWIRISFENQTEYLSWALDNNTYASGEFFDNETRDMDASLRVYEFNAYNATLNSSEGQNMVYACEESNSTGCSFTQYYSDTTAPYFQSITYTPTVELGSLQAINADARDAVSQISSVLLSFNNTNQSMQLSGGKYVHSLNLSIGQYNFKLYANDSQGWANETEQFNFTVNDTSAPLLVGNITNYPNTTSAIDPNITINFNFTLSDYSSLAEVKLQHRPNTTSEWENSTTTFLGAGRYAANFTPSQEAIYYYRVYAKDSFGNILYSANQSINATYERYWTYSPLDYNTTIVDAGQTLNLYNITLTNTGDVPVSFEINKSQGVSYTMVFSNESFTLEKNQSTTFQVNVTAPGTGDYPSTATITCVSSLLCTTNTPTGQASSVTVGKNLKVGETGPYLSLKIYRQLSEGRVLGSIYNLRFNDNSYTTPHELVAEIQNVAELYDAENISFGFVFPNSSGWVANITTPENMTANFSLERKNYDDTREVSVKFTIDRKTNRAQIYNVTVYANLIYNGTPLNFSHAVLINVTNVEEQIDATIIIPSGGGGGDSSPPPASQDLGGGGGNAGAGGGLGAGTTLTYNLTLLLDKNVDIFRGANKTILINISNPYKNKYFSNITLAMSGYYKNYLSYSPSFIERLDFNETKTIELKVTAPPYLGYSINKIDLVFDFLSVNVGQNASTGDKSSQESSFNLVINEVSREESMACLEKSMDIIRNATGLGYNTRVLQEKMDSQRKAIASMDFTLASSLCDGIAQDFLDMQNYAEMLFGLSLQINQSLNDGYDMSGVLKLYNISQNQFSEGQYSLLESSLKDVQGAYALQIKLEDADLSKRFVKFVKNNLLAIALSLIIIGALSFFAYSRLNSFMIKKRLEDLAREKADTEKKMKELQDKYYAKKLVSPDYFGFHMEKYKEKIAQIEAEVLHYNSLSLKFDRKATTMTALEEKENSIKKAVAELQKKYFVEKSIDKKFYEKQIEGYNKSLSDTKKQLLVLKSRKKISGEAGSSASTLSSQKPAPSSHKP